VTNFYYAAIKNGLLDNIMAALVKKYALPLDEKLRQNMQSSTCKA